MTTASQNEYVATTSKIAPSCWVASLPYVVAVMASFIMAGMSNELVERLGPLPRTHGLLAAMLTEPDPSDLRAHNPKVAGSNPAPATKETHRIPTYPEDYSIFHIRFSCRCQTCVKRPLP